MTEETWGRLRHELIRTVGQNNYKNWIEPLEFARLEGGVITFLVPTSFMGKWVQTHFGDKILTVLNAAGHAVSRCQFVVAEIVKPTPVAAPEEKPVPVEPANDNDLPGAALDPRVANRVILDIIRV